MTVVTVAAVILRDLSRCVTAVFAPVIVRMRVMEAATQRCVHQHGGGQNGCGERLHETVLGIVMSLCEQPTKYIEAT